MNYKAMAAAVMVNFLFLMIVFCAEDKKLTYGTLAGSIIFGTAPFAIYSLFIWILS